MHAAKISHSPRLMRVDAVLASGREYSTLEISNIRCRRVGHVWYYQRLDAANA